MASCKEFEMKTPVPGVCGECQELWHAKERIMVKASSKGHFQCIKACLAAGADVNVCVNVCMSTPLSCAVEHNHYDCVELLIKAGAKLDWKILDVAGRFGNERCVNLLLQAGGNPVEMLCASAKYCQANVVQLLITAGANVNNTHKYGRPLVAAVKRGSLECVKVLVQAGADVNHGTVLTYALEKNYDGITEVLIKAGALRPQDADYKYNLKSLVQTGSERYVNLMIEAGVDVNSMVN